MKHLQKKITEAPSKNKKNEAPSTKKLKHLQHKNIEAHQNKQKMKHIKKSLKHLQNNRIIEASSTKNH